MHLFVRTLCLVLFVAEHSVIPFMSLFFKYLGLSPLWSGIIRSCQSCLPVVCYLTISLIKNCNNFFPKRRTIIYLLIFINIGVHTCLIFIPPSASIDIMHCFEQFTDSDSKFHSEIGETREAVNYTAPSVNHFVSTNKSIPSELNQFKESHSHNDPSYGEYHTENSDKNYKINHNSENVNPLFKNGIIPITNSMASRYRQHDSKSIQKVRVPLNSAENSLNLMEKTTQKDYLINMNSHFGATTKPLTFQKVRNQAEIIRSHSPYDKSEEHRNNDEIISNGKHNLIIKGDEFLKNQALKKVETIFGSNHATLSKNYKGNLFTNHPNHAVSLMHTSSESTLSAIIENVKVKAAKQAQQSGDLPGENAFQKASNKALYDVDKLYGPADNFLPTSTEKVKLRYGKVYEQLVGLTTENTFYTDTKNDQLNLLNKIFLNAFFKNKKQSFRPFDISRKPKKILKINAVLHTTPISVEQDTSIEKGINYFRGRRSATENAEVSKDAFKYIKSSENMSSTVHLQTFEETVGGSHDVILKDKFAPNTTFSNLYVTFTFSLTLEFLNFICFLLIENMYSLNIMNVLFSHHISFPIWALIVCPILIIGSLLCPCPFQIATHFIVAIAILLIGMLLLICVPVGVLEIYTARKRKNSKPTYKSDNSYHFHYRIFSSLVVAAIGFLTACNSEFIMWHLHTDSTFSNNYEFLYCGYVMTSFLIHFITIRMWKQYKLVGEVEKEDDDDSEEWEPQSYELKDVEQSCSHWPRLAGLVSLATQMLLLPFLRPVWLLTLVAGILQGLTESFVLSRKYPYKAGYAAGCFVAGFVVQVHGTRILFLSAAAVTLVFILILLVSNRRSPTKMRWFRSAVLLGLGVVVMAAAVAQEDPGEFKEVYMWNKLAFDFPDDVTRVRVLSDARLDNCLLHALRLWKGRLFATLPRWRAGVPVTLASLPAAVTQHNVSGPNLTPFPSWDMQAQGNCSALQSVVGVEVDLKGRLWAADSGAVNTLDGGGTRDQPCKPKVVQFDAETGRILRTFQLGDDVVAPDSLLADVVVGDDDMAYVSDASPTSPGIIVLDGRDGRSWKMSEPSSMRGENMFVQVEQRRTELRFNVFALALSPRDPASPTGRRLYYAPLNSKHVFSLPVSALADPGYRSSLANLAKDHGERASPTQAMTLDSAGRLYSGPLTESGVDRWDTTRELSSTKLISQDHVRLQWPSSLTVDEQGFLWVVSNRMHVYMAGTLNQYDSNYRVIRASVGAAKSYMHDLASSSSSQGQGQGLPPQTTPPSTTTTQHATPHKSKTNAASPSFLASAPLMLAVVARVAFA